jgi:hypothetical protein
MCILRMYGGRDGCRGRGGFGAVLSSAKIGTASWRYYTAGVACRASEYYLGVGEAPGRWHGRGLAELGLTPGAVASERELEALFARGLHPSAGTRLGRAWRSDGVTGFDLTFSAPKSVSALWALGDPSMAAEAMAAHRAGPGRAGLPRHARGAVPAGDRRGRTGQLRGPRRGVVRPSDQPGRGPAAAHPRADADKVRCADGRWRTLDATELFHHKKSAGMVYQAALRNEMHQRLGVSFREVNEHGQADIARVPDDLLSLWSKRTASIDAEAGSKIAEYERLLGRTWSAVERVGVVKTAVLKTRAAKQHPELCALHATWTAEAASAGWTPGRLRREVHLADGRAVTEQDRRLLPTEQAGPSGLARPPGPVLTPTGPSAPQEPAVVLPAPDAVLPAAGDLALSGDVTADVVTAGGVPAAALQAAATRRACSPAPTSRGRSPPICRPAG